MLTMRFCAVSPEKEEISEGTTRNFNQVMATAAKTVIVEADEVVDCLDPNIVTIPGIFVDYIVAA